MTKKFPAPKLPMKKASQMNMGKNGPMLSEGGKVWDDRESITLKEKDIPAIKSWQVGQEYTLEVKVQMVSKSMDTDAGENQNKHDARFKITSITVDDSDKE